MWNAPLTNGTTFSVAIGCALFLFGLSIGLVIAGVCWAFIAASSDPQANSPQESYPYISDDEIDIVIELVREAIAGSGWTICGDCYTRQLLQQLPQPPQESERTRACSPTRLREPASTHRVEDGRDRTQNTPNPGENRPERSLQVEQGERMGRVTSLSH
jgi:hypothetical protein